MSTDAAATEQKGQLKETERVQAGPGPGRGPFGGGMVGQKANNFKPSARRLLQRMSPEKHKAVGVLSLTVVSVGLMSLGPRVLGRATDLIFTGLMGRYHAAHMPGGAIQHAGVDFAAVAYVLELVLVVYVASSVLSWLQGYLLNDVVQGTTLRMRSDVEDKV